MRKTFVSLGLVGAALALCLSGAPAQAQATRTWVSGVGDDANPCSRTAPCKTFAGAISKTATGGYINCLDPGGFGAVTITKAITIQCEEETGHVLQTGGFNGINVNVAAGTNVTLRGLTIEGAGSGGSAISLNTGGNLHLQEIVITGWTNSGVNIVPNSGTSKVFIIDTYITDTSTNAGTAGIRMAPTGGAQANVEGSRVSVENSGNGIVADGTGGGVTLNVRDSVVSGSSGFGVQATSTASGASAVVSNSTLANNGTGANANGGSGFLRLGGNTISGNATGVSATAGGTLQSFKNNQIVGNGADGTPINAVNSGGNILN